MMLGCKHRLALQPLRWGVGVSAAAFLVMFATASAAQGDETLPWVVGKGVTTGMGDAVAADPRDRIERTSGGSKFDNVARKVSIRLPKTVATGQRRLNVRRGLLELLDTAAIDRERGACSHPWVASDKEPALSPSLVLSVDWSAGPSCWPRGQRNDAMRVAIGDHDIGGVVPGVRAYRFGLRDVAGRRLWLAGFTREELILSAVYTFWDRSETRLAASQNVPTECHFVVSGGRIEFDVDEARVVAENLRRHAETHHEQVITTARRSALRLGRLLAQARDVDRSCRMAGECADDQAFGDARALRVTLAQLFPLGDTSDSGGTLSLVRVAAGRGPVSVHDILALSMVKRAPDGAALSHELTRLTDGVAFFEKLQARAWALGLVMDPAFVPEPVQDPALVFKSDAWLLHAVGELI